MKFAAKILLGSAAVAAIALAVAGCGDMSGGGYGPDYTPVYGDYGYVGPWESPEPYYEGGVWVAPPYRRYDRDHHDDRDEHRGPAPERRGPEPEYHESGPRPAPPPQAQPPPNHPQAPVILPGRRPVAPPESRPIPSIPNAPRPARTPPPQNSNREDERKRP